MTFEARKNPCNSCPYRKDCPSGVWAREEYEKLRAYDHEPASVFGVFLCHLSRVAGAEILCKGWFWVHRHSVAVRLLLSRGLVSLADWRKRPLVGVYRSGNEAADAGERAIRRPGREARAMAQQLKKTGRFHNG